MVMLSLLNSLQIRVRSFARSDERGDVPGWVLVTVMTAALVVALLAVAAPKLTSAFTHAISSVTG
jgi:Tfp pilus assembly protein PilX